jgi:hypothetical protein
MVVQSLGSYICHPQTLSGLKFSSSLIPHPTFYSSSLFPVGLIMYIILAWECNLIYLVGSTSVVRKIHLLLITSFRYILLSIIKESLLLPCNYQCKYIVLLSWQRILTFTPCSLLQTWYFSSAIRYSHSDPVVLSCYYIFGLQLWDVAMSGKVR